jgi:hypothetical protein
MWNLGHRSRDSRRPRLGGMLDTGRAGDGHFHSGLCMHRILVAAVAVVALLRSTPAAAQQWSISRTKDQMLDRTRVVLRLEPTQTDAARPRDRPSLIVRCGADGELAVFLSTDTVLDASEYAVTIMLRWGKGTAYNEEWSESDSRSAAFASDPQAVIDSLQRHRQFRARVPLYPGSRVEALFAPPPIPASAIRVFATQCGFLTAEERARRADSARAAKGGPTDQLTEQEARELNTQIARERARGDSLRRDLVARQRDEAFRDSLVPDFSPIEGKARADSMRRVERGAESFLRRAFRSRRLAPGEMMLIVDSAGRRFALPRDAGDSARSDWRALDSLSAADVGIHHGRSRMNVTELRLARWAIATGYCAGVHGVARGSSDGGVSRRRLICADKVIPYIVTVPAP